MRAIPDNNLAYPVMLTVDGSFGSGFFVNSDTAQYLVTARHVLFNDAGDLKGKNAGGISYSYPTVTTQIQHHFDLERLLADGNLRKHANADVAVAKVATLTLAKPGPGFDVALIAGATRSATGPSSVSGAPLKGLRKYDEVLVANDVYIFGYPRSIGHASVPQIDGTRPLLRKGIVAGKNDLKKTIIIDCPVYQGNSGGLVIEALATSLNKKSFLPIGVVSAFVPFVEEHTSAQYGTTNVSIENSGYAVVTPMDRVLELI